MSTVHGEPYRGVWIDYTRGSFISGLTITLTSTHAKFFISGLTALVTITGGAAWTIVSFLLHQYRCTRDPTDALHLQQQVLLRNSSTSISTTWYTLKLWKAWRTKAKHAARRLLVTGLVSLLTFVLFVVFGILVAKVATPAYEINNILLKPQNCGLPTTTGNDDDPQTYAVELLQFSGRSASFARDALAYADTCYSQNANPLSCSNFAVRMLPYTKGTTDCMYEDSSICISDTLQFDSTLIDTNDQLGVNTPLRDRLQMRFVDTCSVIDLQPFITSVQDPHSVAGYSQIDSLNFGPSADANVTFYYNTRNRHSAYKGYTLSATTSYWAPTEEEGISWVPLPQYIIPHADLSLILLESNGVSYAYTNNDPLFKATGVNNVLVGNFSQSMSDYDMAGMLCARQYELSNPANGLSSGLVSYNEVIQYVYNWTTNNPLELSVHQASAGSRLTFALNNMLTIGTVGVLGSSALLAERSVDSGNQSPSLPDDQWKREVEYWFQISLAILQQRTNDFPTNAWYTGDPDSQSFLGVELFDNGTSSYARAMDRMCNLQRVRSSNEYSNFSLVGVVIVVVMCAAIILFAIILEPLCDLIPWRKENRRWGYTRVAYTADGKFNLLRQALQQDPYDTLWQGQKNEVPTIGDRFGESRMFKQAVEGFDTIAYPRQSTTLDIRTEAYAKQTEGSPDPKQDEFLITRRPIGGEATSPYSNYS